MSSRDGRHRAALTHLCAADPALAGLIARVGPCTLRPIVREPFEALFQAIAHQQLHARAAEAILGRFRALLPASGGFPDPASIDALPDAALGLRVLGGQARRDPRPLCPRPRRTGAGAAGLPATRR